MTANIIEAVREGNRRALARLLSQVENQTDEAQASLAALYPHTGNAWVIGITGAPGTGKSSLVSALTRHYRAQGLTVGVIAVDPTSPFSGGAILGDRIRMRDHSGDKGVFIRSMATRGSLGGLSRATRDMVRVLDAAGFDRILVETVGAGQSEVDIVRTAHTTIVVEAPGLGDDVQAIKAGILEIADVLVVNKADRPGADSSIRALKAMLELGHPLSHLQMVEHGEALLRPTAVDSAALEALWVPPIIPTIATDDSGIVELANAVQAHRDFLDQHDLAIHMEAQRLSVELYDRLREALIHRLLGGLPQQNISQVIEALRARQTDPHQAVRTLLALYEQSQEGQ